MDTIVDFARDSTGGGIGLAGCRGRRSAGTARFGGDAGRGQAGRCGDIIDRCAIGIGTRHNYR